MTEIKTQDEGVEIDLCDHCGGAYFDFFDGEPGNLSRSLVEIHRFPTVNSLTKRPFTCPDCGSAMAQMRYLETGPPVHRCDNCVGVFIDADQIEPLSSFVPEEEPEEEQGSMLQRLKRLLFSD
jgi:Zn-finger nucleic acid-binding protein